MALHSWTLLLLFLGLTWAQDTSEPTKIVSIPEEDNVWVLSESNFQDALNQQPDLLVEFYAPWCGHCKTLAPQYAKAALRLKENIPPIRIAKVDATVNKNLADRFGVTGYPTLKYFENQKPTNYEGGRNEDSIVSWILKKTGQTYIVINDYFQLQRRLDKTKVAVVLFAQMDAPELRHFEYTTKIVEGPEFIVSTDPVALARLNVKEPAISLFKQFDDGRVDFSGKFKHSEITRFVEKNMKPIVMELSEESINGAFDNKIPVLVLLSKKSEIEQYKEVLNKVAKKYKNVISFMYGDISDEIHEKMREFLGVNSASQPMIALIDHKGDDRKYIERGAPSEESIKLFIKKWKNKELEAHYKSEEIPEKAYSKNVRVLVGKNFESVVFDKTKDVLVYFYSPWCSHCKEFEPVYQKLAKQLHHVDSLVLAKIDYTVNEVKDQSINSYPTIKFFPAKKKKGLEYDGERSLESVLQFIKDKASIKFEEGPRSDL